MRPRWVLTASGSPGLLVTASDQLEELFAQLVLYLDGTAAESAMKMAKRMPSYEDYLHMRMAANGTGFFFSLAE